MRINPIILAQTRLLVPNTLPIKRDAASSAASVVMPEMKTVKRRYFFMYDGEKPIASHLPLEISEDKHDGLILYGHMSRANPQWKTFSDSEALVIFQGAHTYISPRWYNHVNVPTWNYMNVHVYGKPRLVEGDELYALMSRLVQRHEAQS